MKKNVSILAFLMIALMSLSVDLMALPENGSILRLESKNSAGEAIFATIVGGEVSGLIVNDPSYLLENSLWFVNVANGEFTLQNLGTRQYLGMAQKKAHTGAGKGAIYYLTPVANANDAMRLKEDATGYYYEENNYKSNAYIQYDPWRNIWCYYSTENDFKWDPKDESQNNSKNDSAFGGEGWTDDEYSQSDTDNATELTRSEVNVILNGGNLNFDNVVNNLDKIKDKVYYNEAASADPKAIVVGNSATYPAMTSVYWNMSVIQLPNVNSADWTPVSFPIDVKCVTADLAGVGYQYYDTQARATNGKGGWVTGYVTAGTVFNQGVAYHFATESGTKTLEFKSVEETTVTAIKNSFTKTLVSTGGDAVNANWYYIGNALFKDANMSQITMISRYNGSEWVEESVASAFDPFDAFFVQYTGDYTMSTSSAARSSAPKLAREKSATEKYYLRIEGEGEEDQTGIFFEEDASVEGYVIGEDFLSFATIGGANTEIYTYAGDIDYSFNTRPIENTLVYVGLYIAKAGTYTISLDNISGNAETFVLYDNYEQDFVRLHLGETYTFYSERGEFNDRFGVAVTYAPEVPTDNISLSANKLIVVNNEIQGLTLDSELVVYDSTGRLVCAVNVDSETMILPNLNSGIYIGRNGNGWVKILVK